MFKCKINLGLARGKFTPRQVKMIKKWTKQVVTIGATSYFVIDVIMAIKELIEAKRERSNAGTMRHI